MTIDKLDPKGLEAARLALYRAWSSGDYDEAESLASAAVGAYLASTAGVPGETPRVTEAKPIGYAIADYFEDRRAEYEQNGTVIYAAPAGMATTPVYLSSPPVSQQAEAVAPVAWRYRRTAWGAEYWHYFTHEPRRKQADEVWEPLYASPAPDAVEPSVKALEWDDDGDWWGFYARKSPVGIYNVARSRAETDGVRHSEWFTSYPGKEALTLHPNEAEAKAAAQADYDARVRSALVHTSPSVDQADKIKEDRHHDQDSNLGLVSGSSVSTVRPGLDNPADDPATSSGDHHVLSALAEPSPHVVPTSPVSAPGVVESGKLAPADPSDAMIDAALTVDWECDGDERAVAINVWHAMYAAAPAVVEGK